MTESHERQSPEPSYHGEPIDLRAMPERRLIRPTGSYRHVDFRITANDPRPERIADRPALSLALVVDRSGSMAGQKLQTAKQALLSVVDRLDERDVAAIVAFDSEIDVVQAAGRVDQVFKARVFSAVQRLEARASTNLHQGWLTGCQQIAGDELPAREGRIARCFLLTDGLANEGLTDVEQIASDAAGVWRNARITTSTFGIGSDYQEQLLGPMAVAGGGQFHHLRAASEIAPTFAGELEGMFAVVAGQVRLEIEADEGIDAEVVSQFLVDQPARDRWSVHIGDLTASDERHVVVRFTFPSRHEVASLGLRGRLVYQVDEAEGTTDWQEVRFAYATNQACEAEAYDLSVMRPVAQQHADRAIRDAIDLNRRGDFEGAQRRLYSVAHRIRQYAGSDPVLLKILGELAATEQQTGSAPMPAMAAKEQYYQSQRRSRGQRDWRSEGR